MPTQTYDKVIKGQVRSVIEDLSTNTLLVMPEGTTGSFNPGVELGEIESTNCRGVRVTAKRYETAAKPTFSLTVPRAPDVLALALNRKFDTVASGSLAYYQSSFVVPADGIVAARTTGTFGFEVTADAVSKASYMNDSGFSTALVQGTYASFDEEATPLGFAVGAAMAMKFGEDLYGATVSLSIPVTVTNYYETGALSYVNLSLKAAMVALDQSLIEWEFPSVSIDNTQEINISEGQQQISFFVNGDYTVRYIDKLNPCFD